MSENTSAASHLRRPPLLLALLLVAAGLLAVEPPVPDAAPVAASYAGETAHRWAGYRIPRNGHADGRWIGGYQIGKTPVFVITPKSRPNRRGYQAAHVVTNLGGSRGASRRATVRAAWVLSKYGGYRDAVQAAAVDAVVYHLLVGGRWRIGHARGAARVRQSGDPASVRRYARIMLGQARKLAGVYRVTVAATGADVGGTIEATVTVTGSHGRPAAGLPVTVTMPGTAPIEGVTGDNGRTVARFPASQRGWQDVTASVGQVPEHRLYLREPDKRAQAAAAEGGVRRTVSASVQAAVRGPQTMTLQASPASLDVGTSAAVTASITGDGGPRPATATLHGPFSSASAANCSGSSAGTTSTTVTGDGSYRLPALTPSAGGYYAWRVAVEATATSMPVAGCGAVTKVWGFATAAVASPSTGSVLQHVQVQVTVAGMPFPAQADATIALFGPFTSPATACSAVNLVEERPWKVQGNGTFPSPTIQVPASGTYAWQASMSPGDLWHGSESPCLASGSVMTVP